MVKVIECAYNSGCFAQGYHFVNCGLIGGRTRATLFVGVGGGLGGGLVSGGWCIRMPLEGTRAGDREEKKTAGGTGKGKSKTSEKGMTAGKKVNNYLLAHRGGMVREERE